MKHHCADGAGIHESFPEGKSSTFPLRFQVVASDLTSGIAADFQNGFNPRRP